MSKPSEFIDGICEQFLFSPKGAVEGVLIKVKDATVQVSLSGKSAPVLLREAIVGKPLRVHASRDHSPRTKEGVHPVYEFEEMADALGHAIDSAGTDDESTTIKGVVSTLHFARHGQPNGVILETGEFIHLRPHGMTQTGIAVGSKVNAIGEASMTQLGTRMLEAQRVNGVELA